MHLYWFAVILLPTWSGLQAGFECAWLGGYSRSGALHGLILYRVRSRDSRPLLLLQGPLNRRRVGRQVGQLVEDASLTDDGVHQVEVTCERRVQIFMWAKVMTCKLMSPCLRSHHQTDTGWCCCRPPAGRRPGGGSGARRRGTRAWRRPPGGGAVCWLPPWTGSSGKVKLWNHKRSAQGSNSWFAPPPEGSICTVILTVHYDGEQAVEQRLETLVSAGDDFVEDLNMTKYKEQTQWRLKTKLKMLKLQKTSFH